MFGVSPQTHPSLKLGCLRCFRGCRALWLRGVRSVKAVWLHGETKRKKGQKSADLKQQEEPMLPC